jgi:CheY-like chemotaxis protein
MLQETLVNILLIEDDLDIQTITKMALCDLGGFCVETCSSGIEGLKMALQSPPQLILLDIMMPGMDGLATLKQLRKYTQTADIPVVILTAKAQKHEIEQYKHLGAMEVIRKPFDPMSLSNHILDIWNNF